MMGGGERQVDDGEEEGEDLGSFKVEEVNFGREGLGSFQEDCKG
jgi:hypothetical protein